MKCSTLKEYSFPWMHCYITVVCDFQCIPVVTVPFTLILVSLNDVQPQQTALNFLWPALCYRLNKQWHENRQIFPLMKEKTKVMSSCGCSVFCSAVSGKTGISASSVRISAGTIVDSSNYVWSKTCFLWLWGTDIKNRWCQWAYSLLLRWCFREGNKLNCSCKEIFWYDVTLDSY